nr:nicotinate (nicotinamide) nucleotide adenylyltransferase [Pseudodesulfovibrio sp. JC047]
MGGSFNPVHTGHVRMAVEVREQLGLDRVELVPAKEPPHKDGADILPFSLRLEMVNQAIRDIPGLTANPLEGQRPGPSFTSDTLECYRREHPETEFFFILGASTFLELPLWHRGLDIPHMTSMVVVTRWEAADAVKGFIVTHWPDAVQEAPGSWVFPGENRVRLIDTPRLDIKGGQIRRRWRDRRNLTLLVPSGVDTVLEDHADEVERFWGARLSKNFKQKVRP